MGSELDDEQHSLTEYGVTSQSADSQSQGNTEQEWIASDGDKWWCRVCGQTSTDKAIIENCHPKRRLIREFNAAVTRPTPTHTGPVIPPQLSETAISLFNEVKSIVESHDGTASEVLPKVGNRIADAYSSTATQSALSLFTDFVWLRSCHLLPNYPAFDTDHDQQSLQGASNAHGAFEGTVTETDIRETERLKQTRVYREKILGVTGDYDPPVADVGFGNLWQWETELPEARNQSEFSTTILFQEPAAHNRVAAKSRNWLTRHPDIDWACMPHTVGAPEGEQKRHDLEDAPWLDNPSDPPEGPVTRFDFAGFTDDEFPTLAVLGIVSWDDAVGKIVREINQLGPNHPPIIIVFRNRAEVHQFIDQLETQGLLHRPAAPIDDCVEYYSRQPSIEAVNEEFTNRVPTAENHHFVTVKQLVDDIRAPTTILPDTLPIDTGQEYR